MREKQTSKEAIFSVLNPTGNPPPIVKKTSASPLDTLDDKTVYLVDVRFNDGDILLQQVQDWLNEHIPSVNTVFARKAGVYTFDDTELWAEIREKGDAVVMAIGH